MPSPHKMQEKHGTIHRSHLSTVIDSECKFRFYCFDFVCVCVCFLCKYALYYFFIHRLITFFPHLVVFSVSPVRMVRMFESFFIFCFTFLFFSIPIFVRLFQLRIKLWSKAFLFFSLVCCNRNSFHSFEQYNSSEKEKRR